MVELKTLGVAALAIGFLQFGAMPGLAQTPPPADAFLSSVGDLEISPDGRYVSMIQPYEGRTALVIYPMGGGDPQLIEPGRRGPDENLEVENHFWAGPERLVIEVEWNDYRGASNSNWRDEQRRMISIRPDGSDPQVLFESRQDNPNAARNQSRVISTLPDDPDHILVTIRDRETTQWVSNVHKVNVLTGRSVIVGYGGNDTRSWALDNNDNVVIRVDREDDTYRIYHREIGSIEWDQIFTFVRNGRRNVIRPIVVLDDGKTLYLRSDHEGRQGIYTYDLTTRGGMQRLFLPDNVDVGGISYSRQDDELHYVWYREHDVVRHFYDQATEDQHNLLNRLLPGANELVVESTDDETVHIISSYGPGEPTVYYLMDENNNSITELAQVYPGLGLDQLGAVSVVDYQARDGMDLNGYLVLPPGTSMDDGPFPLVLNPHGGPQSRDYINFDGLRQFIATRGYAVFEPNFRGSTGFGNAFEEAGYEEWGGAMQDDLTDAVQHLVDQGIADPDHMCIVGWSYSAYAALMAAVSTPDLFNCAVGINGVYDLPEMQRGLELEGARSSLRYWRRTMGSNMEQLALVSPGRRADEIRIPTLILASEQDQTAPYQDSLRMIEALRRANRNYESHIYEYGNHSLDYRPSRRDAYERIERFLAEHM